ncbi:MAG: glucose-1-phosphate thymidylyltransferase [Deltaproteobacteria bacterium]|nr:MAG: glucose-1-phosphate thymidylyltransferase [Deltaproteobacteria bacterium]
MLAAENFFDLGDWGHPELFSGDEPVWQVLTRLKTYLAQALQPNVHELSRYGPMLHETLVLHDGILLTKGFELVPGDATKGTHRVIKGRDELEGATVFYAGACLMDQDIFVGPGSVVEPGALIKGPTIIGAHCEIRQGAYVRGHCLVGDRCVVGHTTEMKHSVMLNGAKAGHFAYIGDSILGNRTNLGAGTKLANLKITDTPIRIKVDGESYDTGLRKLGAILGDGAETGCNSVTNPGTLLGRGCLVYPAVSVRGGYYKERSIISGKP